MNLTTKFSLNEKVWLIRRDMKKEFRPCEFCNGTGKITCNGIDRQCPECYGRKGSMVNIALQWQVVDELTIGQICCKVTSLKKTGMFDNIGEYDPSNLETEITYMAYETGVGSGNVYRERDLFIEKDEAQKLCDELNAKENI